MIVNSKRFILSIGLLFSLSVGAQSQNLDFGKLALQQSVEPIRPGIPGVSPFWNEHAMQFIHAPAFDFKKIEGASQYDYIIESNGKTLKFKSGVPYAALSPVWSEVPVGNFKLKVEAIAPNGKPVGIAGEGEYYRAAWFNGPYHQPVKSYSESAQIALQKLLKEPYVQYWLKTGKPDPSYGYYRYPAKIIGALIVGAVTQAHLSKTGGERSEYTKLARSIADYLISISFEKGTPLEFFPPTYDGYEEVFKKSNKTINTNNDLVISAAEGGHAYLDLYDLTKENKYLEAAKRIASTYKKTQLGNGSWYLFIDVASGEKAAPNIAIPTAIINYFDRLAKNYHVKGLEESTQRAVAWIMENPVKTFDWQGQFEDINAKPPYKNQSREQACDMAIYLLNNAKSNPLNIGLAEELIRFSEDQFVIWDKPVPLAKKSKSRSGDPDNWIPPTVQEQFAYWMPVGRAAGVMMETYRKAHEVTGKDMYLAKATSLANTFTVIQAGNNGRLTTYFVNNDDLGFWLNSTVYPAKFLMEFESYLTRKH